MSAKNYRPLRIWCDLAEPVVYFGDGMCFDGILAAAWFRDLSYGITSRWPSATRDEPWVRDLELPLARWAVPFAGGCHPHLRDEAGMVWGWHASAVHAEWSIQSRTEVRKRVATDEMQRWSDCGDVDVASGRYKAHDLKLPARIARRLEWYAVGDADKIQRVLQEHITAVGRKVGMGNGRVLRWRVDEWQRDWSIERAGRLTRPMPQGYRAGPVQVRGVRPLYWHPSRQIACVVPIESNLVPAAA